MPGSLGACEACLRKASRSSTSSTDFGCDGGDPCNMCVLAKALIGTAAKHCRVPGACSYIRWGTPRKATRPKSRRRRASTVVSYADGRCTCKDRCLSSCTNTHDHLAQCTPQSCGQWDQCLNKTYYVLEEAATEVYNTGHRVLGHGVRVTRAVRGDSVLLEFEGKRVSERLVQSHPHAGHIMQFRNGVFMDLTGTHAAYVNHSCDANSCVVRRGTRLFLASRRPLDRGEAVTIDYRAGSVDAALAFHCMCGASQCRGNDDVCFACNKGGDLVCCDSCSRAFHHGCHGLKSRELPLEWNCQYCVPKGKRKLNR